MIYVIEIPHQSKPRLWAANDTKDFCKLVSKAQERRDTPDYDKTTIAELLENAGYDTVEEAAEDGNSHIAELKAKYADAPLYRQPDGEYTDKAISEYDFYKEIAGDDLSSLLIFETEQEAREALTNNSQWTRHGGIAALQLLTDELK